MFTKGKIDSQIFIHLVGITSLDFRGAADRGNRVFIWFLDTQIEGNSVTDLTESTPHAEGFLDDSCCGSRVVDVRMFYSDTDSTPLMIVSSISEDRGPDRLITTVEQFLGRGEVNE